MGSESSTASVGTRSASLPFLNGDASQVTFSGFSAGCFMSHEMSIIYPDEVAGAVETCCWNYGDKATLSTYSTASDLNTASQGLITTNVNANLIGNTSHIANQKHFIWGGADDTTTPPSGQEAQNLLY